MKGYTTDELVPYFIQVLNTPEKKIEYIMNSLTSAKEIYKDNGHVVMKSRDQTFRLHYDNRRHIISEDDLLKQKTKTKTKTKTEDIDDQEKFDLTEYTPIYSAKHDDYVVLFEGISSHVLLDSRPVKDVDVSRNYRYLMKLSRNSSYNKETSGSSDNSYKSVRDIIVRNFLKGLLHTPPKFNLYNDFSTYDDIIVYLQEYDPTIKMTKSGVSNLKNRKMIFRAVPRNAESLKFVDFLKLKYPGFDVDSFLKA